MVSAVDLALIKRALTMAHAVSCTANSGPNETSDAYLRALNKIVDLERQQVDAADYVGWVRPTDPPSHHARDV